MAEKPKTRRRTPSAEKELSYEREGRNTYGENDKASRKAIPAFKARSNRELRRKVDPIVTRLARDLGDPEAIEAALSDATFQGLHPLKRKSPDEPLGLILSKRETGGSNAALTNRRSSFQARVAKSLR